MPRSLRLHRADAPPAPPAAPPAARRAAGLPRAAWLLAAYLALWSALAAAPADRGAWWLENLLPLSLVALLVGTWRHWPLSDRAYAGIAAFLALHAVGAHWGYPDVPAGWWLRDLFHAAGWATTRNPYDRVVHFAFGLLLLRPFEETLRRVVWRPRAAAGLAVVTLLAAAGAYEVLEWGAARLVAGPSATTFVGAQGDPWDAQQDVALAAVGAAVALLGRVRPRRRPAATAHAHGAAPGGPSGTRGRHARPAGRA